MVTASSEIPSTYSAFAMDIDVAYFVAWLLPIAVGAGIWFALRGTRATGDRCAAIGAGWLIGIFIAAGCARLTARAATAHAFEQAWPWFVAIGALGWIVAFARRRALPAYVAPAERVSTIGLRIFWCLLLAWIVMRLLSIGDEAALRPVFPWDAWSAWSTKPKAWFLAGHFEPYVSMLDWLQHPHDALRTAAAWKYPELLAWIELWFASAAHVWNEPLVDLAWCGALCAFALAAYGYWRGLGLSARLALVLVYALVSLPLIDAHVALAGYADLWLAIALGLVSLAWTRWLIRRERSQWILAVALALCLPAIKLEGMIWLLAFAAVALVDLVPRHRRWMIAAGGVVFGCILLIAGAGSIVVTGNRIDIASLGSFALGWHGVGGALVASLFTLPNWHLLWYVLPVLLVLRRRRFREDRAARLLGVMLLLDFAFLFVLFFLTNASAWAQDFTSANRLILQLVPSVFVLAAVLLRPIAPDVSIARVGPRTVPASAAPIARA